MKNRVPILAPLTLMVLISGATIAFEQPDPGPEDGGLRLRLVVLPHPKADIEGYDVRVDVLNTTKVDITLRAGWWYDTDKGDAKDYIEAETVTSQIVIRDLGVKKMIAPDLYWGLSVIWDGKEYKRDTKHTGRWKCNGPGEISPKTAWRTGFSLSEYLLPAEVLTAGRHTIALKDAFTESNTLTVFVEPKDR